MVVATHLIAGIYQIVRNSISAGLPATDEAIGTVAYLTGSYPMFSHTFILREVQALRRLGLNVLTCSIRKPNTSDFAGPDEIAALQDTFYVLESARNLRFVAGAFFGALAHGPRRWASAAVLAWRTRSPGPTALLWQFFYLLEATILAYHLRRIGAAHLHNHFGDSSGTVAMLASRIAGVSFSFTLHGPTIFFEPKRWRIDEKVSQSSFVVCVSHFARSQAMLFSDKSQWDKLKIVHCGVHPARYRRDRQTRQAKRVAYVGRLDAVKGVTLLLDAFLEVLEAHPTAKLTVVGNGPARSELEVQAENLGASVEFLGYQSQDAVAELLSQVDLLVLPSFAEGVPVVLMEAMASELPVIASRVAGVPELVEDGVSGFLVPPGDLKTLSARLLTLLSDPALCERMGKAGRSKVTSEFDIDLEAETLLTHFRATISSEQRHRSAVSPASS